MLLGSAKELKEEHSTASSPLSPLLSCLSSSMGALASPSLDSKNVLELAFSLPLLGHKRPVLWAKLACLFCRRWKIQHNFMNSYGNLRRGRLYVQSATSLPICPDVLFC
jgi:hypothetical protein